MSAEEPKHPIVVRGTEIRPGDDRQRHREKIARITLDSMVQFVGLLDASGTVLEINKVALDAVGIKLADVEGRPFWTTFWWQVSAEVNATLRAMIVRAAQGEFVRWDAEIFGRAGGKETIIIDASLMPVKDDTGAVVFICAEGRDITEKKAHEREIARQREELAQLDKLKTQFFANVSHEFRTPLTLMLGPLEEALADPKSLSIANRERLDLTYRNSLRLLKLVNTLLDFSRIEAGRIQASYEPTDLPTLTAELASVFRSAIERAGLRLVVDCSPLADAVYVDREMWEKIVLNLLSNAFKFTFEGEIAVTLQLVDAGVRLTIRDTGTGIPPAEVPRLFERFHRVTGARGRSYEGSGIGLALVQELTRLHGGAVSVESQEGHGSTFAVTVPRGKAHLPRDRIKAERTLSSTEVRAEAFVQEALRWLPDARPDEHPPDILVEGLVLRGSGPQVQGRILLADDNADMREYVRRLLSGYEVEAVSDGYAALRAARERRPDLILTDVMMPGMDGFGLLHQLRDDPHFRDVPIVLLSARAGEESRIEGLGAGADDYLTKPFSGRELLARVQTHLQLARSRREAREVLRVSEERFRALVTATSDVVYRMNADWSEMRHLAGREFIADTSTPSRTWVEKYIHPDDRPQVLAAIGDAVRTRSHFQLEHRVVRVDGSVGWTFSRAVPLLDDAGNIAEWFGAASDVTARKQAEEELKAADRKKDDFIALLAHELRNPLAPLRNGLQVMRLAGTDSATTDRARSMMDRQLTHMVRLIDDLLDVSRINRNKMELRRSRVLLADVVLSAVETARPVIDAGGHELHIALPQRAVYLDADMTRLAQVFSNLLTNSAKYTNRGGRIWLSAEHHAGEVVVTVRDNGIGIPAASLENIFDMFSQVDRSVERSTGGLGIGLALVKGLVEMHGGTVSADSAGEGQGSVFAVTLPRLTDQTHFVAGASDNGRAAAGPMWRILVVDDNRDGADSLAMMLRLLGNEVQTANDVVAALEVAQSFTPDVILMDVGMPRMNGLDATRHIRAQDWGKGITIIALTGWGQEGDRERSRAAGCDGHLVKPVNLADLERVLGEIQG